MKYRQFPPISKTINIKIFTTTFLQGKSETIGQIPGAQFAIVAKKLVKEVRINLALDWFDRQYPDLKIIYLIRNPFAVTASRARSSGGWEEYFDREKKIVNNTKFFSPSQLKFIDSKNLSNEEKYFLSWCMENIIPLKLLRVNNHVQIVYYEDLILYPTETFSIIFNYLNEEIKPGFWEMFKLPSKTSSKKRGIMRPQYIQNWRREMKPLTIKKLQKCSRIFEVDKLYPDYSLPNKKAFRDLMTK